MPVVLAQMGAALPVIALGCAGAEANTVRSAPLSLPLTAGVFDTTLIRYAVPAVVPTGIVTSTFWLPLPFEAALCKVTGDAKDPEASDNWAVKVEPVKFTFGL